MKRGFWLALGLLCLLPLSGFAANAIPWMGKQVWVLGLNYPWIHFGDDFSDGGYDAKTFKSDVDRMAASGVHTIRWWIYPRLYPAPLFSGKGKGSLCTGLPAHWVDNMVDATHYADSKGIKIYFCWLSFDMGHKNNTDKHDDIVTNPKVRASFFENGVKPIVEALGNDPGVMGWDIINEPEWIIRAEDNGGGNKENDLFTLDQIRDLVGDFVKYIRPYVKQPISVGSAGMKWCGKDHDFYSGLGLDFFDFHYYDWQTPWYDPITIKVSDLNFHADNGKPVILGEVMGNPVTEYTGASKPVNHYKMAFRLYKNGYAGYLPWAWNSDDNIKNNPDIVKSDFLRFYKRLTGTKAKGK